MDFKHLNNLNFNRSLIFKDSNFRQSPYKLSDWQMFLEKRIRFWPLFNLAQITCKNCLVYFVENLIAYKIGETGFLKYLVLNLKKMQRRIRVT